MSKVDSDPDEDGRARPPPDEDRCRVTRKQDGGRCKNQAVADLGICVRHIRERATLVGLSGGIDLDVPDLD